jgi:hypothetical protein
MDVTATATVASARPGKSLQAVGHLAKAAIAEAKSAGIEVPKNAQGMAASSIARGAEPSSVFAALIAQEAADEASNFAGDNDVSDGLEGAVPPDGDVDAVADADAGYMNGTDIVGDGALEAAKTAVVLLNRSV